MPFPKKWIPVLSFLTVAFVVWLFQPFLPTLTITWDIPQNANTKSQITRPPESNPKPTSATVVAAPTQSQAVVEEDSTDPHAVTRPVGNNPYLPGKVKPVGQPYTKTLILPRTKEEDTNWVDENFAGNEWIKSAIYTVDDIDAELHPPKNKGHEVMVYLSYIIDHYHNLSDVNIFMHSHRYGWHNNELLDNDAVQMISRLSAERVQREGFVNMRCHWDPGCPSWMHPGTLEEDINKQEETMLAKSWSEIFPLDPIPHILAQPCCAQFAISRDRIQGLPLARYVFYRDWLLRTSLSDYISGRVWEYVWQFVFTGKNVVCPKEHICYCDGFGVCFGGEDEYNDFYSKNKEREQLEEDLRVYNSETIVWKAEVDLAKAEGRDVRNDIVEPEIGKNFEMEGRVQRLNAWLDERKQKAKEHGDVAMNRANEAGREWHDGDGF